MRAPDLLGVEGDAPEGVARDGRVVVADDLPVPLAGDGERESGPRPGRQRRAQRFDVDQAAGGVQLLADPAGPVVRHIALVEGHAQPQCALLVARPGVRAQLLVEHVDEPPGEFGAVDSGQQPEESVSPVGRFRSVLGIDPRFRERLPDDFVQAFPEPELDRIGAPAEFLDVDDDYGVDLSLGFHDPSFLREMRHRGPPPP
ncbi:hypothetical protein [Streptomyces sp. NPDC088812]|uniref:hypothetical protein n=1 Tax=Streptomyces sp. NPDC088812 TaxID=3365905 RepID=UPI003830AC38